MQRAEEIEVSKIGDIVSAIFSEPAVAYQDYSDFDSELKQYKTEEALLRGISSAIDGNAHSANFSIYYPEAKGYFFSERKSLNPAKCNGATFRYVASGWGLIQLQIDLKNKLKPAVSVSVNSQKRAEAWFQTYPEFKEPSLWEWKYVEKQARRIIRVLKQCA
ncbi:hypothetical protein [Pleionea sediminis]|uniref:hypothetical protein n=1 Tax=Pleionea sediminis TaxID=2569479 RepID=UPI0011868633|nr:hypothetical protein [Pleionea sediminis]